MRKPRDFDAELKALSDKAHQLKERRLRQLGELVIATGADVMPLEQLAGALIGRAETEDHSTKEGWRQRGAAFFQRARKARERTGSYARRDPTDSGSTAPPAGKDSA